MHGILWTIVHEFRDKIKITRYRSQANKLTRKHYVIIYEKDVCKYARETSRKHSRTCPGKKPNPMKDKKYSKWNDFNTGNIKWMAWNNGIFEIRNRWKIYFKLEIRKLYWKNIEIKNIGYILSIYINWRVWWFWKQFLQCIRHTWITKT